MINRHEVRAVSASARCHPDTVTKYLLGGAVRLDVACRIVRALREHDHESLIREHGNTRRECGGVILEAEARR